MKKRPPLPQNLRPRNAFEEQPELAHPSALRAFQIVADYYRKEAARFEALEADAMGPRDKNKYSQLAGYAREQASIWGQARVM